MVTVKLSDSGAIIKTAYEGESTAKVNNLDATDITETVDKQFVAQTDKDNWDNFQGFSGDYNDLTNRPTAVTKTSDIINDSNFVTNGGLVGSKEVNEAGIGNNKVLKYNELSDKLQYEALPTPFSKEYNDLLNKPTIPTNVSDLTNDSNFVSDGSLIGTKSVSSVGIVDDTVMVYDATSDTYKSKSYQSFSGSYDDLTEQPAIATDINDLTDLAHKLNGNVGSLEVDNATIGAGTFLKYNAVSGKAEWTTFSAPTNVDEPNYMSELYNDVGYVTDGGKIGSKKVNESGLTGNGMLVYSFADSTWKVVAQSALTNIVSNVESGTILDGTIQEFLKQVIVDGNYPDVLSLPISQTEDFIAYIEDIKEIYTYKTSTGWLKKFDLSNSHSHTEFSQINGIDIDSTNLSHGKVLVYNDVIKSFEYAEVKLTGVAEENQIASEVPFDNSTSNLVSTNVQELGVELNNKIQADVVTSIDLTTNILTYTDELNNDTIIDLSPYLDDTKIVSATLNAGLITFTNSDASSFTLNVSDLLDDTNLITTVAGRTGDIVLVESDITNLDKYTQAEVGVLLANKVDKVLNKSLILDSEITRLSNIEDNATADQTGAEIKTAYELEPDTNALTDSLLALLTTKKVKDITLDAVTNKVTILYTDDTTAIRDFNDVVTDIFVNGASLDGASNVLTLSAADGGADVTVDLSDFVNSGELVTALSTYYTKTATDLLLADKADKLTTYTKDESDAITDTKVAKVTSTDNAIVIFDGITGDVKDSGLTTGDIGGGGIGSFIDTSIAISSDDSALANDDGTANNNIAMGIFSSNDITTGIHNVSFGLNSLSQGETPNYNVAIGNGSLYYSNADYNIGIGRNAGFNAKGANNIGIGQDGLKGASNNLTGSYNTGIGYQTGYNLTTGQYNVLNGYQAGYGLTSGSGNIILGQSSANALAEYSDNVVIGSRVAEGKSKLQNSVIIGKDAVGWGTATANQISASVIIGEYAGNQIGNTGNTSGNVFIGQHAGSSSTEGSKNVCIGPSATTSSTTASNELHIANNATESLIEGDFASRELTVNGDLSYENQAMVLLQTVDVTSSVASVEFTGLDADCDYKVIVDHISFGANTGYLEFRYYDESLSLQNTSGDYVFSRDGYGDGSVKDAQLSSTDSVNCFVGTADGTNSPYDGYRYEVDFGTYLGQTLMRAEASYASTSEAGVLSAVGQLTATGATTRVTGISFNNGYNTNIEACRVRLYGIKA